LKRRNPPISELLRLVFASKENRRRGLDDMNSELLAYIFGIIVVYIIIYAAYPVIRTFRGFLIRSGFCLAVISALQYFGIIVVGVNIVTAIFCGLFGFPGLLFLSVLGKVL